MDATALVFVVFQVMKLRYHLPVCWWLVDRAGGVGIGLVVILSVDPMHRIGYLAIHAQVILLSMLAILLVVLLHRFLAAYRVVRFSSTSIGQEVAVPVQLHTKF